MRKDEMLFPACRHRAAPLRVAGSWLPPPPFLANYAASAHPQPPRSRASNGCSKKEDFAIAPEYAALAPCAETGGLCRMPELRRAETSASPVRSLRVL